MKISPTGDKAYITDSLSHQLRVLHLSNAFSGSVIPLQGSSQDVVFSHDGRLAYVTVDDVKGGFILVMDAVHDTIIKSIRMDMKPLNIVIFPDIQHAYVSFVDSSLIVGIDLVTGKRITSVNLSNIPYASIPRFGFAANGEGLFAVLTGNGVEALAIINIIRQSPVVRYVDLLPTNDIDEIAVSENDEIVYGSSFKRCNLIAINTKTDKKIACINVGITPQSGRLVMMPTLHKLFFTNYLPTTGAIYVVDTNDNNFKSSIAVHGWPAVMDVTPDWKYLYVIVVKPRNKTTLMKINTETNEVIKNREIDFH